MPADKKHLSSTGQRILKITAGILGGYFVSVLLHNAIGSILEDKDGLIVTSAFTSFLVWSFLLVIAFLAKNGWKVWAVYMLLILIFIGIIFLNK
ncbi:hypothetical protein [Sphingobacterium corticibacterium]|uniref:Iron transporter n=1 Tax=Sphingobacterium corticibacterium TaxID=2484746 RepID=A0A4V2DCG5_9SPHI|nr:hypothetical protein [Sphingobacterium corticibacterium]RZF61408.1 hypothetical protein EWE74_00765 [Sphingobacterium corticibacterium]